QHEADGESARCNRIANASDHAGSCNDEIDTRGAVDASTALDPSASPPSTGSSAHRGNAETRGQCRCGPQQCPCPNSDLRRDVSADGSTSMRRADAVESCVPSPMFTRHKQLR